MKISYKKLWKLLIDRNMTKTQLRIAAGISSSSLAKLGKDENVTTSVLLKVCSVLKCDVSDIMGEYAKISVNRISCDKIYA